MLKYGHSSFRLDIIEYCKTDILIEREQYYIDVLKPDYNISKKAGSRLGTKQSEKTKLLISNILKNRTFSDESKEKMKIAFKLRLGEKTSMFGKTHTTEIKEKISLKNSLPIKIINIETSTVEYVSSNVKAAKYLGIGISTMRRYKKKVKFCIKNT